MIVDALLHLLELGEIEISEHGFGYSIHTVYQPIHIRKNRMPSPEVIDNRNANSFHMFLKDEVRYGLFSKTRELKLEDADGHVHEVSREDLLRLKEACAAHVRGEKQKEKYGNEADIYKRLQRRLDEIIGEHE